MSDPELTAEIKRAVGEGRLAAEVAPIPDPTLIRALVNSGRYDVLVIDAALALAEDRALLRVAETVDTAVVPIGDDPELLDACREMGAGEGLSPKGIDARALKLAARAARRLTQAEKRARGAEDRLARHIGFDDLTGLPNRALFTDRLQQAISYCQREQQSLAVMLLDINRFRDVNAGHGRPIGDRVLQEVGIRLRTKLRESDSIGRIGADRFAALLPTGATLHGALNAAGKLVESLRAPIVVGSSRLTPTMAVGISLYPAHGDSPQLLLDRATQALAEAKATRGGLVVYGGADGGPDIGPLALAGELRQAIAQGELFLSYQPKVQMATGKPAGVEALVRWRHPSRGLIMPDVFVPLAERTGSINPLTHHVLDLALGHIAELLRQGHDLHVSVNLSAVSLHDVDLPGRIGDLLRKWQVRPDHLVLELTETAIINDTARAVEVARRLKAMGMTIAIDDFGTGHTSFAYVRSLPVGEIKIDKSFVQSMGGSAEDKTIVRLVVEMAQTLGLKVVAEGVEDLATWDTLVDFGCTMAQGYYVSRPLDAEALAEWLAPPGWSPGGGPA
ncbi:MAG: bifunctional diguanylate cyclase/phosphodiesterase [Alphaproteobacteria bacterium]|nr:bifunctional diguanylate cyclase/phosphodiesterase [Alphaproteobacteria bacterium]